MECAPARRCTANRAMNGLQEYAHPEPPANTVALALGQSHPGGNSPRDKRILECLYRSPSAGIEAVAARDEMELAGRAEEL